MAKKTSYLLHKLYFVRDLQIHDRAGGLSEVWIKSVMTVETRFLRLKVPVTLGSSSDEVSNGLFVAGDEFG